jgi:hypothetical protein
LSGFARRQVEVDRGDGDAVLHALFGECDEAGRIGLHGRVDFSLVRRQILVQGLEIGVAEAEDYLGGVSWVAAVTTRTYLVAVPRGLAVSQYIIDRRRRFDIQVAAPILVRQVVMHERPHLDDRQQTPWQLPVTHLFLHRLDDFLHGNRNSRLNKRLSRSLQNRQPLSPRRPRTYHPDSPHNLTDDPMPLDDGP